MPGGQPDRHNHVNELQTVREVIDRMAIEQPSNTFLICPEEEIYLNFEALRHQVTQMALRLSDLGLRRGDRVAFLLDNGVFTAELFLGAMYGGFVAVPLNPSSGKGQIEYVLHHSDARLIFASDQYSGLLDSAAIEPNRFKIILAHCEHRPDWKVDPEAGFFHQLHKEDVALLAYTSGSTGRPKGVLVTHGAVLAGGWNTVRAHQLTSEDRSLCVLPLSHMNAQIVTLISTLLSGGSVVIPQKFSVALFWDWISKYKCTWFAAVPTIISHLVNWTNPQGDVKSVRFARSSSAPLSPSLHHAFEEKFEFVLIEAMGLTEAGGAIFSNPLPPQKRKIGSAGIAYGFETRITDAQGCDVQQGQTGNILVRGPSVMKGYFKTSETQEAIGREGWLHTGDIGYQDQEGYFFIIGRSKELIIKSGENIAPREIDEALASHPAVLEAATVGIPDSYLGEDIIAYVVLKLDSTCSEADLLTHCTNQLGAFKTPSSIHFVEDLPRGPSGKILRLQLPTPRNKHSSMHELSEDQKEEIVIIWREVLGFQNVGKYDNFFELGGDSLKAFKIISRLRGCFQVELSVRSLFERPTIAELASLIAQNQKIS